ncbi:uncharacterized protein ISCGN_031681 [Ixodes scapularis]
MRVPRPASLVPLLLAVLLLASPPGRLAGADSQQQFKQDAVPPDVQVTSPASEDYYDSDYEDDPSEVSTARPPTPDKGTPLLLPEVTFACVGRSEGYYADVQLRCEVFHYCKPDGVRFSFVCPPKSSFNQKLLICDYDPAAVSLCADSDLFFHLNDAPAANASSTPVNETSLSTEEPVSTTQRHRLRKPVTRPATIPTPRTTDTPATSKTVSPQPVFGRPNLRTTTVPSTTMSTTPQPPITLPSSVPTPVLSPSATPASIPATASPPLAPADQDDEDDWIDDSYPSVPANSSSIFDTIRQDASANVSLPWEGSLGWPQLESPWSSRQEHSHSVHSLPETTRHWWRQTSPPSEPVSSVLYSPLRDSAQYAAPRDVPERVPPTREHSHSYTPVFDRDALFEHLRQASAEERPEDAYSTRYHDDGRRLLEPPHSRVTYSEEQHTHNSGYTSSYDHMQHDSPSHDRHAASDTSNDLQANSFVVYDQRQNIDENRQVYDPYAEHPMRYPHLYGEEHYSRSHEGHRVGHDVDGSEASKHHFSSRITDFKGHESQNSETAPHPGVHDIVDTSWARFKDGGAYRYEGVASDSSVTEVQKSETEPKGTVPPPWKPMAEVLMGKETPRLSGSYHKTPSGYFEFRHGWKSSIRKRSIHKRLKRQLLSRLFKRQPIRLPQLNSLEPPRGMHVAENNRWMPFPFGVSGFHPGANIMRVPPPPPGFQASQEFQADHKPEQPPMQIPPQFFGRPPPPFRRPPPFFAENNFHQNHKVQSKFQQEGMQAQQWEFPFSGPPPREVMMRPGIQGPHFPDMSHGPPKENGHGPTPRPPSVDTIYHSTTPSSSIEITLRPMTGDDDSGEGQPFPAGHEASPPNLTHMQHQEEIISYTQDPHTASSPFAVSPTPRPGEFITEVEPPQFALGNHEPHGNSALFHHTREQSPAKVNLVAQDELIRQSGQTFPVNHHVPEHHQEPQGNMNPHVVPDVRFGSRHPNVRPQFENFLPPAFSSREPPRMSPQLSYVQWKHQKPPQPVQRPPGRAPEGIYIPAHIANMRVNPQLMMGMVQQQSAHVRPQHGRRPPPTPDGVYPGRPGPRPPSFPGPKLVPRPMPPRPAETHPARAPQRQRPPPERPTVKLPVQTAQPEQQVQLPQIVKPSQPARSVPPIPPTQPPIKPRRRKPGRRRRPKPSTPLQPHAPRVPATAAPSAHVRSSVPRVRGTPVTTPYSMEPLTFGGRTGPHGQRRPVTNNPRSTFRPATATRIVTSRTTTRPPQTTTSPYSNALRLSLKQSVSQKEDDNKTYSWYGGWTKSTPSPSAVRHHMPTAIEATLAPAYKQAFTFPARIMATGQPTAVATTPSTWSWPREPSNNSAAKWSSASHPVTSAPARMTPWSSSASVVRVFSSKIGSSVMATSSMPKMTTTTTTTTTTSTTTTPRPKITVDEKENVIGNGHDKGFPFEFFTDVGLLLSRTTPRTTPHPQPVYKPPSTIREPVTEVVTAISFSESGPVYFPKGYGVQRNNTVSAGA